MRPHDLPFPGMPILVMNDLQADDGRLYMKSSLVTCADLWSIQRHSKGDFKRHIIFSRSSICLCICLCINFLEWSQPFVVKINAMAESLTFQVTPTFIPSAAIKSPNRLRYTQIEDNSL